jgi:type IV pilus assembly protein PilB
VSHGSIDDILARINRLEQSTSSRTDENKTPQADTDGVEPVNNGHDHGEAVEDHAGFQTIQPASEIDTDSVDDDEVVSEILSSDTFRDDIGTDLGDESAAETQPEPSPDSDLNTEQDMQAPVFKIGKEGFEEVNVARPLTNQDGDEQPSFEAGDTEATTLTHSGAVEDSSSPVTPISDVSESSDDGDGVVNVGTGYASNNGLSDLFVPDEKTLGHVNKSFGDILAEHGAASKEQILAAENVMAQTPGKSLTEILIEQGVDEAVVQAACADYQGLAFERIDLNAGFDGGFDGKLLQRLGVGYCAEHCVLPLRYEGTRVVIAATRPDAAFDLDEIKQKLGCSTPKLVLTTMLDIKSALEIAGADDEEKQSQDVDLNDILEDVEETDVEVVQAAEQTVDLEQQAGESPVIRYVNYIIQSAVREGASDIHIEPQEKKLKVRLRVDGLLFESMNPPASMAAAITSRIKIMANLDISERRLPQDGRIRCTVQGRKLDLRVSTLPAAVGEKIVMRILDTKSINVKLEDLGFEESTLEIWRNQVRSAHGIVLVTGPTGSGKTTTLYSSIRQLDKNKLNISTCEDPIEYHLDGITQTQTHEKIGMTFSKVLRALLRQDPDVIMVGEIRDQETAHIAIQAALTGHLVLSTLHTNDAPSSLTRLVNIGLEPFLVGAAVNAVLAQRLVRKLCVHCKDLRDPPPEQVEFLELSGIIGQQIYQPVGCDKCRQIGYSGRVGIYELLSIDDQMRDIIARNPNVAEFRQLCLERGMASLRQDGMNKVAEGVTTVAEVLRVTAEH